ncbi:MAG: phosphatidylglycerol lysyltransferase domain-containing protein [Actinomycetes bacterium]
MSTSIKRSKLANSISLLLYLQSLTLFGFFSAHALPHFIRKLGTEVHPSLILSTEVASILTAACLFMTARGIKMRRRRAWIIATSLQIILIVTSLVRSGHYIFRGHEQSKLVIRALGISHLLSEILILWLLLHFRKEFKTYADPLTRKQSLLFFLRAVILAILLGVLIVYSDTDSFASHVNFAQSFEIALKGLVGISGPVAFASDHAQNRLELFLGGLGFIAAVTSLAKFLKPIKRTTQLSHENSLKIRGLLATTPDLDSLSYFALRDNKTVIWSKNLKAAIPYSVVNGVMITTGDPVGDRESWPSAIAEFINESEQHAWIPAVYGCSENAGEIWVRESGYEALEIGDEAIVDVATFTIDGPVMKNVRQTLNKISRSGYSARSSFVRDLSQQEISTLLSSINIWRQNQTERGFSMALGRFCDLQDPDCVITWAMCDGQIVGILQFVPWGSNSLSLDVMKRSRDAETGVNELMIQKTIEFAAANNFLEISLNFATFRSIFERGKKLGAGPITRLNHRTLVFLSRFFQMESLYRFNAKFAPRWEPRFIVFPTVGNLVRVGYAILKVEAFIPDFSKFISRKDRHE